MKDVTPVIDTMRMIIRFREMYDMCMGRIVGYGKSACGGCPYMESGTCGKISTADALNNAADIFQEFLEE